MIVLNGEHVDCSFFIKCLVILLRVFCLSLALPCSPFLFFCLILFSFALPYSIFLLLCITLFLSKSALHYFFSFSFSKSNWNLSNLFLPHFLHLSSVCTFSVSFYISSSAFTSTTASIPPFFPFPHFPSFPLHPLPSPLLHTVLSSL